MSPQPDQPDASPAVSWSADELRSANSELAGAPEWAERPTSSGRRRRPGQRDESIGWLRPVPTTPAGLATQHYDDDQVALIRLSMIPGIGPRMVRNLTAAFDRPIDIFRASAERLASIDKIGPKTADAIRVQSRMLDVDELVHWCNCHDTRITFKGDTDYPKSLLDLDDSPPLLFQRGFWEPCDAMSVAIVGTRHATRYGIDQATKFGYGLARCGVTVISGLARGIDAAAHEGALDGGGRTLAVLGGGMAQLYPAEHAGLAEAIVADGAVICENPPHTKPKPGMFPQRNRLVASLARAVLVIEAPSRSGSLITARLAGEQNREVMAIPGPINSRASRGCNDLIRDGAKLIQSVEDVLEELGPLVEKVIDGRGHEVHNPIEVKLNEVERKILDAIPSGGCSLDHIIQSSGLPAHQVTATVTVLEVRRIVRRASGNQVLRA